MLIFSNNLNWKSILGRRYDGNGMLLDIPTHDGYLLQGVQILLGLHRREQLREDRNWHGTRSDNRKVAFADNDKNAGFRLEIWLGRWVLSALPQNPCQTAACNSSFRGFDSFFYKNYFNTGLMIFQFFTCVLPTTAVWPVLMSSEQQWDSVRTYAKRLSIMATTAFQPERNTQGLGTQVS